MKKDKKQELRSQKVIQLNKRLEEINTELAKLKLDLQMGRVKNTNALSILKNERAVILTIISEKQTEKA